jgi:tRNA (guanine37-N1)-methyltransferase
MFEAVFGSSIIKRAVDSGLVSLKILDIRNFSEDKNKSVDDYPYGGGAGQLLSPQPIFTAMAELGIEGKARAGTANIFVSPRGLLLDFGMCEKMGELEEITILCGHYEGVDERVLEHFGFLEISIGDYILTGGELPAMVVVDSVVRLLPGVLGNEASAKDESIASGLLEYPQYTRPASYNGLAVPEVLLNGHHKKIEEWRLKQAELLTKNRRPDLYARYEVAMIEKNKNNGK